MGTDLELYRVFCEVVKYKNISKAAENMYVSQSAVTQSIMKLENLLGGKLFYRSKKGVELTEEGSNLYEYIKDSIETMSNAENIFSEYVNLEKGRIRIGGGNSIIKSIIKEPLVEYIKEYPNIDVSIRGGVPDYLIQGLANGELDLVVLNLPYNTKKYANVELIPLKKASYVFFATKEFVKENKIKNFKDCFKYKMVVPKQPSSKRRILEDYCEKENIEFNANYEVSSTSVMKELVLSGIGTGFANKENVEDILDKVDIIKTIELKDTSEGIAVLKKSMSNKATQELVKKIKDKYKQNL